MPADPEKTRWKMEAVALGGSVARDARLQDAVAVDDPSDAAGRTRAG